MTTERERLERQWRKNQKSRPRTAYSRRNRKHNPFQDRLILIMSCILILLILTPMVKFINLSEIPEIQRIMSMTRLSDSQLSFKKPQNSSTSQKKMLPKIIGDSQTLQKYDYRQIDHLGASINYQGTSVQELANQLNRYVSTDLEKARLIYAWIAHHIAYDFDGYLSNNYGDVRPEGILKSRKGVCSGYANLYRELAQKMGLEAEVIDGYSKGYGYAVGDSTKVNHAWNGVKINGSWYLVDSTWGAGHINNNQFVKKFKPFYFATPPHQFIYDHFPQESHWQLLAQLYSREQFEQLPKVSSTFFEYQIKLVNDSTHTLQVNEQAEILLDVPENIVISTGLFFHNSPMTDNYTLIQKGKNVTGIYVTVPSAGTYELKIFAKPKEKPGEYYYVMSYRLVASQAGQPFPVTYGSFSNNKAYLASPLQQVLPAHQATYFQLNVPNAQEVQIISESSSKWTPLSANGSVFEGNILLEQGKVTVVAKFPNQSSYQSLIEYEAR